MKNHKPGELFNAMKKKGKKVAKKKRVFGTNMAAPGKYPSPAKLGWKVATTGQKALNKMSMGDNSSLKMGANIKFKKKCKRHKKMSCKRCK